MCANYFVNIVLKAFKNHSADMIGTGLLCFLPPQGAAVEHLLT